MARNRRGAGPSELDLVRSSPRFDAAWYAARNPDVALSGLDPALHYLVFGGPLGRDPGPGFDAASYAARIGERLGGRNPLVHFERRGGGRGPAARRAEDAPVEPLSRLPERGPGAPGEAAEWILREILERPAEGVPERMLTRFDGALATRFLGAAADRLAAGPPIAATVSVVLPTHDRAASLGAAVDSVLAQTHRAIELIVVDDGSADETPELLARYDDPRLVVLRQPRSGVAAARNAGLARATGDVVAYLDSDNVWTPDTARLMALSLAVTGARCGHAGARLQTAEGAVTGYRGEPFDWEECLRSNYVDMNVFFHDRALGEEIGGFDTVLRRVVDWDFLLRCTRHHRPVQAPFLACLYADHRDDATRITVSEPHAFRMVVQEKARHGLATALEAIERLSLRFAIRVAAPRDRRAEWGDFHFAESLAESLVAQGHQARIDFRGEWRRDSSTDVVIALRGLAPHAPEPGPVSLLWTISHPDQVSYDEYAAHDAVLTASASHAALLGLVLERPVHTLPQCTDRRRFRPAPHLRRPDGPALFVGNSRKADRPIVRWAVESGEPLEIWGTLWEGRVPPELVRGENVPNTALSERYAAARCVLNDHWPSMRDFGIVSNRVFDVVASGGRLVSDHLPGIAALFGRAVETVASRDELVAALRAPPPEVDRAAAAAQVAERHSFDARAAALVGVVRAHLAGRPVRLEAPAIAPAPRRRVGLLVQRGRAWPTSSAFLRLIAPLTTEAAHRHLEPILIDGPEDPALETCDLCVVQRVAVPCAARAERLVDDLRRRGVPLFVDTDDAFGLHDGYAARDAALRLLMGAAAEVWFSTEVLSRHYAEVGDRARVVPNQLDPRLWRDYRAPPAAAFGEGPLRLLYMGTTTHEADFAVLRPALEALAADRPGSFELALVRAVDRPAPAPWLKRLRLPMEAGAYPRFARWLMAQRGFDVGVAPLAESPFNDAKSDVKTLDYSAMGLLTLAAQGPAYADRIAQGMAAGVEAGGWRAAIEDVIDDRARHAPMRRAAAEALWETRSTLVHPHPLLGR